MKHVVAGLMASGVFIAVCLLWAVLAALLGTVWALVVIIVAIIVGVAGAVLDYLTEKE